MTKEVGAKHDQEKIRWSLLPWDSVELMVKGLMYGSKKYGDYNWKNVPDSRNRYFAALMRHMLAWFRGEELDKESGLSHLAHAGCCLLFLMEGDKK